MMSSAPLARELEGVGEERDEAGVLEVEWPAFSRMMMPSGAQDRQVKLELQPESSLITSASPALCTRGRFLLLRVRARVGVALRYAYRHNHRVAVIVTHA